MKSVHVISGRGVPLRRSDVDTDQIIPAEWLKRVERTGFEKGLFATWRDDRNFVLNDERYIGATVLVTGPSFGVGSSREHAVWAIQQYGFDAVISRVGLIYFPDQQKALAGIPTRRRTWPVPRLNWSSRSLVLRRGSL
jgi:3-isopropylmalate/(R)-2-methylmalate dehydratase small subunit